MLNLIIVDDEKTTRDSLETYIPWKELGIDSVTTAKNGLVALELAEKCPPDIILSDVRMPKMDGIELAINIRSRYPQCKIIFLSGYSDKEYLKSAINLKAVSYIEKPIQIDEIKTVISETVALCLDEEQQRLQTDKLNNIINENVPLIRQEISLELIKDNPDLTHLSAKYEDVFNELTGAQSFAVFAIDIYWFQSADNNAKLDCKRQLLKAFCSNSELSFKTLSGFTEDNFMVVIALNEKESSPLSIEIAYKLQNILNYISSGIFSYSIGIGTSAAALPLIQDSFYSACSAVQNQFYHASESIFEYSEWSGSYFEVDKSIYSDFKNCLKKQELAEAVNIITLLTETAASKADNDINSVKNVFFNLLLIIFEVARENHYINKTHDSEKKYIWQEIDATRTLYGLSKYVISHIETILVQANDKDSINRKLHGIMKYVHEHYAENSLTIQGIAQNVFLSQTYLCAFFKKSTGKTLNEFITEVRIEKSKELLKDSNIKLYEVATSIGFTDANYFSTLFKKYTGCTPSEFRERVYP
ncbi:MAG: response regulator [Eubacterium sp.]|nr:response regulator [Eubacterium sp.]